MLWAHRYAAPLIIPAGVLVFLSVLCFTSWMDETLHSQDSVQASRVLSSLLRYCDTVLRHNKIRYSVSMGTLLGLVRTGELLPWDIDVDVRIHDDDIPRLLQYTSTLRPSDEGFVAGVDGVPDGDCFWDDRARDLTKGDVQIMCRVRSAEVSTEGQSWVHADIVKASYVYPPYWANQAYLFDDPLQRGNMSGVEVDMPSNAIATKALNQMYGRRWPVSDVYVDSTGQWHRRNRWKGNMVAVSSMVLLAGVSSLLFRYWLSRSLPREL